MPCVSFTCEAGINWNCVNFLAADDGIPAHGDDYEKIFFRAEWPVSCDEDVGSAAVSEFYGYLTAKAIILDNLKRLGADVSMIVWQVSPEDEAALDSDSCADDFPINIDFWDDLNCQVDHIELQHACLYKCAED